jgi:hypothetical protein
MAGLYQRVSSGQPMCDSALKGILGHGEFKASQCGLHRVFSTTQSKSYFKDKLSLTVSSSPAWAGSKLNRVQCHTLSSRLVWAL